MNNPLRDLLDKAGLSVRAAAERYDLPKSTIQQWCSGEAPRNVLKLIAMLKDLLKHTR